MENQQIEWIKLRKNQNYSLFLFLSEKKRIYLLEEREEGWMQVNKEMTSVEIGNDIYIGAGNGTGNDSHLFKTLGE